MTATKVLEEPLNQGTADGSVPAATNGQVTTTGQATTSGQTANEAGGNMFTQIKVKNMTCLEGKECSRSNLMVARCSSGSPVSCSIQNGTLQCFL